MALVIRRNRAYEYRSIRRGGRVTSEYVGGGGISAESARFFRRLEAGRKAERAAGRADWEAERCRLAEAERALVELVAGYDELAAAALIATGHHRPQRGRWRRRRQMAKSSGGGRLAEVEASPPDPPIVSATEMTDLFDRIDRSEGDERRALQERAHEGIGLLLKCAKLGDERALPALRIVLARRPDSFGKLGIADFAFKAWAMQAGGAKDVFLRDLFIREMESTRDEVAGPAATPLERILAERVAVCRFDAHDRDIKHLEGLMGPEGQTMDVSEYHSRMRDRSHRRLLAACMSLATVRRLALPALQVNIEVPAREPERGPVPFNPATRGGLPSTSGD